MEVNYALNLSSENKLSGLSMASMVLSSNTTNPRLMTNTAAVSLYLGISAMKPIKRWLGLSLWSIFSLVVVLFSRNS